MWNFGEEWGGVLLFSVTLNNFHSYIVAVSFIGAFGVVFSVHDA
jgi:hypothetical protein